MTAEEIGRNFENAVKGVEDILERTMRLVMEKLRTDAVGIIDSHKASATGEMRKNIGYEIHKEAAKIIGVFGTGANVPYSIYRHEGTRPHWPPIDAIQKWVVQKGLIRGAGGKPASLRAIRSGKTKGASTLLSTSQGLAFLIARKISRRGTKGLAFLRMSLNQNICFIASKFGEVKI
jgi:RNA-splicing ligase RtcB